MSARDLIEFIAARGGIARVEPAAAATGRSVRTVLAIAAREGWWRPFSAVVGLPGVGTGSRAWAGAAVLHATGSTGAPQRDLVAVTRHTALHLLGLTRTAPTRVQLVVPKHRTLSPHRRLAITRSAHLSLDEVHRVDGVPVAVGPALVRDLAAVSDVPRLRADVIRLRHAGHLDLDSLVAMYQRCSRFPGRGSVARVLADLGAVGRVDSPLELAARDRFREVGIIFDRGQVAVPVAEGSTHPLHVDLGIAALRFGIEVDSIAHHTSAADLQRDADRRNRIAMVDEDWRILHLTYATLEGERWPGFVTTVHSVLDAQAHRLLGRPWRTGKE